jgi:hypothetical protein
MRRRGVSPDFEDVRPLRTIAAQFGVRKLREEAAMAASRADPAC